MELTSSATPQVHIQMPKLSRNTEKYCDLLGFNLITLGRDFGFNLPTVTIDDVLLEHSTHITTESEASKTMMFLDNEGISFIFDCKSTAEVIGDCIDGTLAVKDIIAVEIMNIDDVTKHLNDSFVSRKTEKVKNGLRAKIQFSGPGLSPHVAYESSLPHIYNSSASSNEQKVVVMQYLCKCKKDSPTKQADTVRRLRFKKKKEKITAAGVEFLCFLIPREQSLQLHRYLLYWLRLRDIDWKQFSQRLVNKNIPDFSLSLDYTNTRVLFNNLTSTVVSEGDLAESLSESAMPELQTVELSGDQKQAHVPPYILTMERLQWLFNRNRIPLELQVFADWYLAYSSDQHGYSLQTLYRRCADFMQIKEFRCPCLMVITDSIGNAFAALMSHLPHRSLHTYGVPSETRLFNLSNKTEAREVYRSTDNYHGLMIGSREMLNIGLDNQGRSAITIFDGLTRGHIQACSAFDGLEDENVLGTKDQWVDLEVVELWSFRYPQTY